MWIFLPKSFISVVQKPGDTDVLTVRARIKGDIGCPVSDLWRMQNGYALATKTVLDKISALLRKMDEAGRSELAGHLRIGLRQDRR